MQTGNAPPDTQSAKSQNAHDRLDLLQEHAQPAAQKLIELSKEQEPVGQGAKKVVFPYGEDQVVGFLVPDLMLDGTTSFPVTRDHDPVAIKKRFYYGKIAHILLPKYLPDVHFVGSQPGMQITDKVRGEVPSEPVSKSRQNKRNRSRHVMEKKMTKVGLKYDTAYGNILFDESDSAHFVDDIEPSSHRLLERGIRRLGKRDRRRATRWLRRVEVLDSAQHSETDGS